MFKCNCPHEIRAGCSESKCPHYVPSRHRDWIPSTPGSMAGVEAEYNAAKDEFERAEGTLARAWHRLRLAADAMNQGFNELMRDTETRLAEKPALPVVDRTMTRISSKGKTP